MKTERPISDIAFTDSVKAAQRSLGSRRTYERMEQRGGWMDRITPELAEFIAQRDSLYLGSATADGRPYIQHRGGPPGFLKVLDGHTLAFADFSGNRQYISLGNFSENDKAFIFLMDYPHRRRIKIWGTAEFVDDDPALLERLVVEGYPGRPERALVFRLQAWDVNCQQHITPRYTEEELRSLTGELQQRLRVTEEENARLRKALARERAKRAQRRGDWDAIQTT